MDRDAPDSERALTVKFIKDKTAEKDQFGSHSRVASAIAKVIRTQNNLQIIGLLGPWGSGKSTVIKFTESELEQDESSKTYCFWYDVWLHQSDPARRSFLETFVHFLS